MMRKTIRVLQEELDQVQNALEQQKTQLDVCQKERKKAEAEIETLKEERMTLKRQEAKPSKNQGEIRKLKKIIDDLQKKLVDSESNSGVPESLSEEKLPSTGTKFTIGVCKVNGHYSAYIRCLAEKPKNFREVDQGVLMKGIMDYFSARLPSSNEEEKNEQEPVPTSERLEAQPEKPKSPLPSHTEGPSFSEESARLDLKFLNEIIYSDRKFPIELRFGLGNIAGQDKPLGYKVSVYAKRIGGSKQQLIDEFNGSLTSADDFSRRLNVNISEAGTYRLQAVLTTNLPWGGIPGDNAFVESDLFQVF